MDELEKRLERFRSMGKEMRMQLLLGYAKRFPDLPEGLREARDQGLGKVEECQTPLFLWVAVAEDGAVHIHADAPREAPTVRGFVGFLIESLEGRSAAEIAELPEDLLDRMGMGEILGVMRTQGVGAVARRIKHDVARASA